MTPPPGPQNNRGWVPIGERRPLEPGHRRGGPIQVAYRTPGLLAANRTGWRRPEQLYRHRLAAAFVTMPTEDPVEW